MCQIFEFDKSCYHEFNLLQKSHEELQERHAKAEDKLSIKRRSVQGFEKSYRDLHLELQATQEELTHTRIQLENAEHKIQSANSEHAANPAPQAPISQPAFAPATATNPTFSVTPVVPIRQPTVQQPVENPTSSIAPAATTWRPRGISPSKPLTGKNVDEYSAWAYTVKKKLQTDAPMYAGDDDRVGYILSQMENPIFEAIHIWVEDQEVLTLEAFFDEVEHYMGIHLQTTQAKKDLTTIKMKPEESVNEYYHRIFKLWQRAKTLEEDRIRQFLVTIKPTISAALVGTDFTTMRTLLDKARTIEDRKKEISFTHFKDNKFNNPRNTGASNTSTFANSHSRSNTSNPAQPRPSSSASTKPAEDSPNRKFMPCATKPAGWVGQWHEPEAYPPVLT